MILRLAALLALLATAVHAHDRSTSFSTWVLGADGADVTVRLTTLEASRLPWPVGDAAKLGDYLAAHLLLLADETPCVPDAPPRALAASAGRLALEWHVRCDGGAPTRLRSTAFLDVAPSHVHFARVRWPDGRSAERLLSDGERGWSLVDPEPPSFLGAVALGVEHIATGVDHLAFVLALLLLGGTLGETVRLVTGFTIAHSVTLALATLGWVRPEQAPVEALIGLSVALVAAENVWLAGGARSLALPLGVAGLLLALAALGGGTVPPLALAGLALFAACHMIRLGRAAHPLSLRWTAAFAFGLLHGFGFAAVLVDAALPPAALARVLLGFNLGVELGQVALVLLVVPLLARAGSWRPALVDAGSAAVAGLGVFWFVSRAYGGG
ncbi:MAG: HupE/UreJ family protein [bacterium]|nr:HupE/UreJ family protein [bacterium]